MHVIGRSNHDDLNTLVFWTVQFLFDQLLPAPVGSIFRNTELASRLQALFRFAREGTGNQIVFAVHACSDAVNSANKTSWTAANHCGSQSAFHRLCDAFRIAK